MEEKPLHGLSLSPVLHVAEEVGVQKQVSVQLHGFLKSFLGPVPVVRGGCSGSPTGSVGAKSGSWAWLVPISRWQPRTSPPVHPFVDLMVGPGWEGGRRREVGT